ncbi:hypothetical protein NDI45_28155 [Leptolyngbya sp. GB1-A1]|uniref:hypothetical protein n=1 Tax=Leptolyngbya sp. GB1-A1 TaxID=2933908 RepID=UPI003296885F
MKRNLMQKIAPWLVAGVVTMGAVACEAGYEREVGEEGIGEVEGGVGEEREIEEED